MPQPSCMCTVLLKLAKVEHFEFLTARLYNTVHILTLIYFSDLLEKITIWKLSPYCLSIYECIDHIIFEI